MKLATYLKKNNLTEVEFADQIGCSKHAVIKWIRGVRIPRIRSMRDIEDATGGKVTAADFYQMRGDHIAGY